MMQGPDLAKAANHVKDVEANAAHGPFAHWVHGNILY
jgi:hypothetical protein